MTEKLLQWHPAFFAGIQIEFGEEAKYFEFKSEYVLGTKPMMIDVLIKKKETQALKKNIGKIFRRYNIVEYKSPDDYLCIDDFYKGYAYTYFYKADRMPVNSILLEELTISFVCQNYPRSFFGISLRKENYKLKECMQGFIM